MTLDEAISWKPNQNNGGGNEDNYDLSQRSNKISKLMKNQRNAELEKKQWQAAMEQAKARGLDKEENARKAAQEAANERRQNSKARRNPITHAKILLKETSLSFEEISDITGLDVYKIITMKLKSRSAA